MKFLMEILRTRASTRDRGKLSYSLCLFSLDGMDFLLVGSILFDYIRMLKNDYICDYRYTSVNRDKKMYLSF